MSRWIDADALTRRWCGMKCGCERDECGREIEPCIVVMAIEEAPSIDIVRCGECKWRKAKMMPKSVKCLFSGKDDDFCSYGSRSEKPNNCEHITEDGVTCAKYPACDDCLDNPLNKVKGSERLVKGSERSSE